MLNCNEIVCDENLYDKYTKISLWVSKDFNTHQNKQKNILWTEKNKYYNEIANTLLIHKDQSSLQKAFSIDPIIKNKKGFCDRVKNLCNIANQNEEKKKNYTDSNDLQFVHNLSESYFIDPTKYGRTVFHFSNNILECKKNFIFEKRYMYDYGIYKGNTKEYNKGMVTYLGICVDNPKNPFYTEFDTFGLDNPIYDQQNTQKYEEKREVPKELLINDRERESNLII